MAADTGALAEIKEVFDSLDTTRSGRISHAAMMQVRGVQELRLRAAGSQFRAWRTARHNLQYEVFFNRLQPHPARRRGAGARPAGVGPKDGDSGFRA